MACVFLLRVCQGCPRCPAELHMDEGQFLIQAMKFLVDPGPWLSGDTGSWPTKFLASYLFFCGWDSKPGFVLVRHTLASVLSVLSLAAYLTLRRLKSEGSSTGCPF